MRWINPSWHVVKKNRIADAEYQALKTAFPHIRHDEEFVTALRPALRTVHESLHGRSLELAADELYHRISQYSKHPETAPELYQPLVKLFPAYERMAAEIDKDYKRWSVRLNGNNSQWFKNPDCWQQRVAQIRNENGQDAVR